ncbi:DinB family protein [Penaeicola halotolerans]|uniref:DinB family protein n=1 Tax=Penaeicola halotolerans TaxID=2793196 RepID=UPI001CF921D7|nr:DinB family protein [Penaeicola halotolerans]
MKVFFKELFNYNKHVNLQLIDLLSQHEAELSENAKLLMSHILNAHHIWNHRMLNRSARFSVWQLHLVSDFHKIHETNLNMTLEIIDNLDLDNAITYSNSKGQVFQNTVQEVLFHIINHSTYHRGQIATSVKSSGIAPLATDYIFYKR